MINKSMDGKEVKVHGWVNEIRDLGGIKFIILRSKGELIQITLPESKVSEEIFKKASTFGNEDVIEVEGEVQKTEKADLGVEVIPEKIELISEAESPLPLDPSEKVSAELDTRLDKRFMDLRRPAIREIFTKKSKALQRIRNFFQENEFIEIQTPKIIGSATEGGTELFPMDYFGEQAYLAQSPQLYKQMMMATGFDRVFEIDPIFRAEEHDTFRHLNESWSIDGEISFIENEEEPMKFLEKMLAKAAEISDYEIEIPLTRLKYDEAIEIVQDLGMNLEWGEDLGTEAERKLGEYMEKERNEIAYFIKNYPSKIKPFYIMKDGETSRAFDLDVNGIEISSGGQREHRVDVLEQQIASQGLNPEEFEYYLEVFRYGMPPHGGFGLGLERLIMVLLDLDNIRESTLFPRDRRRLRP